MDDFDEIAFSVYKDEEDPEEQQEKADELRKAQREDGN